MNEAHNIEYEIRQMIKDLTETLAFVDKPATIQTNMQNMLVATNRITYLAGRMRGSKE